MKYLVKIALGLFVYMAVVASCKDDDDSGITGFSIDKEDITMGADGGKGQRLIGRRMGGQCVGTLGKYLSCQWFRGYRVYSFYRFDFD